MPVHRFYYLCTLNMASQSARKVTLEFYNVSAIRLPGLPGTHHLSNGASLTLDNYTDDDLEETFKLIRRASEDGNNVCVDELETLEELQDPLVNSIKFILRSKDTGELMIVLAINPQLFTRTFLTRNPSLLIYGSSEFLHGQVWADLIKLGVRLMVELDRGYTGCIISVFPTCQDLLECVRQEKFTQVAVMPKACRIAGRNGLREYFVFHKQLDGEPMEVKNYTVN